MKNNKKLRHSVFFNYMKSKYNILTNVENTDKENRQSYSNNIKIPENQYNKIYSNDEIWKEAVDWLEKSKFKKNIGPSLSWKTLIKDYLTRLPITHKDVLQWLDDFIYKRLNNFGKFQDVIIDDNNLLYHSGLSIYINNGLITPKEIIDKVIKYKTSINNLEGFLRQILGWREYARYYYLVVPAKIFRQNIFKNLKKIDRQLYNGTTNIPIVNKTIKNAFNYGYINHIQRLMVIANYMNLSGYSPDSLYKWMYEFSLDSYEWVMVFNCYSMGMWSDKGFAMRKPYISSATYLLKMSNEKNGKWVLEWNNLYKKFLQKNRNILKHTVLANLV